MDFLGPVQQAVYGFFSSLVLQAVYYQNTLSRLMHTEIFWCFKHFGKIFLCYKLNKIIRLLYQGTLNKYAAPIILAEVMQVYGSVRGDGQ